MRVEASQGEVVLIEVDTHYRTIRPNVVVRSRLAEGVGSCWRAAPGGGEVAAAAAGLAGDHVSDGLAAGDPSSPFVGPVREHRGA
jgi:hypothetical protein